MATFDRDELRRYRGNWDFFPHRRPELNGALPAAVMVRARGWQRLRTVTGPAAAERAPAGATYNAAASD